MTLPRTRELIVVEGDGHWIMLQESASPDNWFATFSTTCRSKHGNGLKGSLQVRSVLLSQQTFCCMRVFSYYVVIVLAGEWQILVLFTGGKDSVLSDLSPP